MDRKKKICILLNLDEGLERNSGIYTGVEEYVNKHTDWTLNWNHYPEIYLSKCKVGEQPFYDGIIGRISEAAYEHAQRLSIPMVNVMMKTNFKEIPASFQDFKSIGRMSAEHMLSRGFKRFIHIDPNDPAGIDFLEGVKEVLSPLGYDIKSYRYNNNCGLTSKAWERQMATFSSWKEEWEFPLAVLNSQPYPPLVSYFLENNIRIPEDIAMIAGRDEKAYCESIKPHLTAIDGNTSGIGYKAAKLLDQIFKGEPITKSPVYTTPGDIIIRESTDTYATGDQVVKEALRFISKNILSVIEVGHVVDDSGLSRSNLEKRFRSAVGHTIKDEIDTLRVISAKRLLSDRKAKIYSVHKSAGFSSALHMRRVFMKIINMTPGDYRRSLNN